MKAIRPARALAALTFAWIATATATAAESETWVLRAARYVDVEAGRVLAPAVLVVAGPRIVALNPPSLPAGARTLELPGLTLLPGFIDAHTHLGSDLGPGWERRGVEWTAVDYALLGVRYARETLLSGFTTVRDVGSVGFSDVALMHAVERGDIVGPRIVPAGHGIGITGGHCDSTGYAPDVLEAGPRQGVADGPDELVAAVRYQIKHGSLLDAQAIAVLKKHGTWLVPTLYQWFESYELPPLLHEKNEYIKARIGGSMCEAFKAGSKWRWAPMRALDRTGIAARSSPPTSRMAWPRPTRSVPGP
jgi:imidazolonepropionase-like amidohydrolase